MSGKLKLIKKYLKIVKCYRLVVIYTYRYRIIIIPKANKWKIKY